MRDFEQMPPDEKKGAPQGHAPQKAKPRGEGEHSSPHAERAEAGPDAAAHAEIIRDERLAHPANAEPLADLLSQLQHSHGNAYVQRVVSEMGESRTDEAKSATESRPEGVAQGLDAGARSQMESAFGEDFGDVRVHTGREAGAASEQLGARAFTHGRDIFFKEGEYDPSTREGRELLAHELTHVVQQKEGGSTQSSSMDREGDRFEREADDIAAAVVRGERARVERQGAAPAYQRQGAGRQPAGGQVVTHFIDAGVLSSGRSEGVQYTFTARGAAFIIDFQLPARSSLVSVSPPDRCPRSSQGEGRERLTVTRAPGESLTIEVSFRVGDRTVRLTIRLPRP